MKDAAKFGRLAATVGARRRHFPLDLAAAMRAQAAQIQKVRDQLENQARAPLAVAND